MNTLKKRLAIVSFVFSPSNHANAKRPYLMAKYFVQQGWEVTVLTTSFRVKGGASAMVDCDGIRVECISSLPVVLIEWASRFLNIQRGMMWFLQGILFPDLFAPWVQKVAIRLKGMDYDCGILNVLPFSSLLLGKYDLFDERWIIDYQESVYPFLEKHPRRSPLQRWLMPKLFELERVALSRCGGVWFTSSENRKRYVNDNVIPLGKTYYLPYFYDPDMYPVVSEGLGANDQFMILYGGDLDISWRSPEPFFRAWREFLNRQPEAVEKTQLVLYGSMDKECWQLAKQLDLMNLIDQRDPVSYSTFLTEAQKSDALLYLDARDQKYFNPGKLADYFGADRPVLAFITDGSEVDTMLRDVGMESFIANSSDVASSVRSLVQLWAVWQKGGVQGRFPTQQYSVTSICSKAYRVIEEISNN